MDITYLPHYEGIEKLTIKDLDDAGIDLRSAAECDIVLAPNESCVIPLGVCIHIGSEDSGLGDNYGLYGMIAPRSGYGSLFLRLANTVGIIDAGYTGEIKAFVRNEGLLPITIDRGDRFCQIIFQPYLKGVKFNEVESLETTNREGSGFGDSGVK